jgi:hypothetical protein
MIEMVSGSLHVIGLLTHSITRYQNTVRYFGAPTNSTS